MLFAPSRPLARRHRIGFQRLADRQHPGTVQGRVVRAGVQLALRSPVTPYVMHLLGRLLAVGVQWLDLRRWTQWLGLLTLVLLCLLMALFTHQRDGCLPVGLTIHGIHFPACSLMGLALLPFLIDQLWVLVSIPVAVVLAVRAWGRARAALLKLAGLLIKVLVRAYRARASIIQRQRLLLVERLAGRAPPAPLITVLQSARMRRPSVCPCAP